MTEAVIGDLAGAVIAESDVEWLVVLKGTRSKDGLDVVVNGLFVPPKQERGVTRVNLPVIEIEDDWNGILHSHHKMGASFSFRDNNELNPRFPVSIVISSNIHSFTDTWLGFSYAAEGRVTLPCGSMGLVKFIVEPFLETEEEAEKWRQAGWPIMPIEVSEFRISEDRKPVGHTNLRIYRNDDESSSPFSYLGDCDKVISSRGRVSGSSASLTYGLAGSCSSQEKYADVVEEIPRPAIFGLYGNSIVSALPTPETETGHLQPVSIWDRLTFDSKSPLAVDPKPTILTGSKGSGYVPSVADPSEMRDPDDILDAFMEAADTGTLTTDDIEDLVLDFPVLAIDVIWKLLSENIMESDIMVEPEILEGEIDDREGFNYRTMEKSRGGSS